MVYQNMDEYLNGKEKVYDYDSKLEFEGYLNGKIQYGKGKEYNFYGKLEFEGEYINGKDLMEKRKNIIQLIYQNLKENIYIEKEKEKNMILMVNQKLEENLIFS